LSLRVGDEEGGGGGRSDAAEGMCTSKLDNAGMKGDSKDDMKI
jgi:hypothetical protein